MRSDDHTNAGSRDSRRSRSVPLVSFGDTSVGPGNGTDYPLSVCSIGRRERLNAYRCVKEGQIGPAGAYRDQFEARFAELVGADRVLSVSNGTTALHLALLLMNVGPGDEVIVPSMTYVATANAIRHTGATPVFADVSLKTWCLDPDDVATRITPRTRGIVPVHLFGTLADSASLEALADAHGLWVVYDAAHAALSTSKGIGSGALGTLSSYSFQFNKTITCGEGGALAINNTALFKRAQRLRSHGMDYQTRFLLHEVGYNYRLSNLHCAILCGTLDCVEEIRKKRSDIAAAYEEELAGTAGLVLQPVPPDQNREVWLYSLLCDPSSGTPSRDKIMKDLAWLGVETRPFFPAIHRLSFHRPPNGCPPADLPVTDFLAQHGFCLPTHMSMTPDDARHIARLLRQLLSGRDFGLGRNVANGGA